VTTARCVFITHPDVLVDPVVPVPQWPLSERGRARDLGENDRSSTGYLPPPEFERVADAFFAEPHVSARGWERAIDAQRRIVNAVERIARDPAGGGTVAIVSHGAVGALLQCHLASAPISRRWDQPGSGGGHWFAFTAEPVALCSHWHALDAPPQPG
jgi:broad specificity phosphatase PhoE